MADRSDNVTSQTLPDRTRSTQHSKEKAKVKQSYIGTADGGVGGGPKKKIEGAALIGIDMAKEDDLGEWYSQVLTKGNMISYYDVSGCYILEPASFTIWETIQTWFNSKIKALDVKNCYFPIFISEENLQREKDHLEGFAAEVAWVTHGGKSKLDKPIAVRPTSETAMYGYFAKKIQSHRDLPLKLNQWNNVVRWEFKHPLPFLRSREFLWQEGHTAHLREKDAMEETYQILGYYKEIYENLLAVPVLEGVKTENEKFPGANLTTTIEGFIPATGRGIQAATSHCLGQHFSKMFGITVEDPSTKQNDAEKKPPLNVWQNSWGLTTRSIGVMVLTHGDNKGLVIPPRVAEIQVIIITVGITAKTTLEDKNKLIEKSSEILESLRQAGVRAKIDLREGYSPGWKFNDWELQGVPLRIELGPKDMAKSVVTTSRRDQDGKKEYPIDDLAQSVLDLLETIQMDMFKRATDEFKSRRLTITDWNDFVPALNNKNVCFIPHCLEPDCEDKVKELTARRQDGSDDQPVDSKAPSMGAKSLCIPFDQVSIIGENADKLVENKTKCLNPECPKFAKKWVLFGRSY